MSVAARPSFASRYSKQVICHIYCSPSRPHSLLQCRAVCPLYSVSTAPPPQDVGCTSAGSEFHRDRISNWTARLGYGYCVASAAGQTFGNMTLFRLADFAYVSHRVLCFADELQSSGQLSESQLAHYARGSECALILELRHISTGKSVIIANASIDSAAAEQNPDMQCLQIALLYRCIQLHTSAGLQLPRASAVLIACNMNSQPSEDAFQFATNSFPAGSPSVRCTRPNPALHASVPALHPETFQQPPSACRLQMRSVYQAVNGMDPLITQARGAKGGVDAFYGCADYMFIAENRGLVPIPSSTMPTPSLASVQCDGGCLPNGVFPSEHVPLGAHFQFLP